MRMLLLTLLLSACAVAPPYNVMSDYELATADVASADIAIHCPAVEAIAVHFRILLPLRRAQAMGAGPQANAAGELATMIAAFENRLALGEVSQIYCSAKIVDIRSGIARVRSSYRKLEKP